MSTPTAATSASIFAAGLLAVFAADENRALAVEPQLAGGPPAAEAAAADQHAEANAAGGALSLSSLGLRRATDDVITPADETDAALAPSSNQSAEPVAANAKDGTTDSEAVTPLPALAASVPVAPASSPKPRSAEQARARFTSHVPPHDVLSGPPADASPLVVDPQQAQPRDRVATKRLGRFYASTGPFASVSSAEPQIEALPLQAAQMPATRAENAASARPNAPDNGVSAAPHSGVPLSVAAIAEKAPAQPETSKSAVRKRVSAARRGLRRVITSLARRKTPPTDRAVEPQSQPLKLFANEDLRAPFPELLSRDELAEPGHSSVERSSGGILVERLND